MTESGSLNVSYLTYDLDLTSDQAKVAVSLMEQGEPIPYIARYRRDETGNLDESTLRILWERLEEWNQLSERKRMILRSIEGQGKLTKELEESINSSRTVHRLENLYFPYRPRKEKGDSPSEKGLDPLADAILNATGSDPSLEELASSFVDPEKGVSTVEEALAGAGAILAERFGCLSELHRRVRELIERSGRIVTTKVTPEVTAIDGNQTDVDNPTASESNPGEGTIDDAENLSEPEGVKSSSVTEGEPTSSEELSSKTSDGDSTAGEGKVVEKGKTVRKKGKKSPEELKKESEDRLYREYENFSKEIRNCPAYQILMINRGEREKRLSVKLEVPSERVMEVARKAVIPEGNPYGDFLAAPLAKVITETILPGLEKEVRRNLTENAEKQGGEVIARNLRKALLQRPLFRRRILAINPGFRYGCKLVALDEFGNFLGYETVYITGSAERRKRAMGKIATMIEKNKISVVAIGNGAAARDVEEMVSRMIAERFEGNDLAYILVNSAGANLYATTPMAKEEFPRFDLLMRESVSIGRRLLNPLAELVKIDPASLGSALCPMEMKGKRLKEKLASVMESAVNFVGVDLNYATPFLLRYVAGLNPAMARKIYDYRMEKGPFYYRNDLKKVPGMTDAIFRRSVGFLKISDGYEPLDWTFIHPEEYPLAERLLEKAGIDKEELKNPENQERDEKLGRLSSEELAGELGVDSRKIDDLIARLKEIGTDPRSAFPTPIFKRGTMKIDSLTPGMELMGTVLNVVDFGAFIDIGLLEPGLIHISRMGDRFVRDAYQCLTIGEMVKVWVVSVDVARHWVSLSLYPPGTERQAGPKGNKDGKRNRRPPRANREEGNARESTSGEERDGDSKESRPRREGNRRSNERHGDRGSRENRSEKRDNSRDDSHSKESGNRSFKPRDGEGGREGGRRFDRHNGRRDRFDSNRPPKSIFFESKMKKSETLSDEMKEGKAPLRSFGDLKRFLDLDKESEEKSTSDGKNADQGNKKKDRSSEE